MMKKMKPNTKGGAAKETKTSKKEETKSEYITHWGGVGERELKLTEKSKLVFSITQRDGEDEGIYCDIRLHLTSDKYTGLTKQGISIPIEDVEEFEELVGEMIEEAKELADEE